MARTLDEIVLAARMAWFDHDRDAQADGSCGGDQCSVLSDAIRAACAEHAAAECAKLRAALEALAVAAWATEWRWQEAVRAAEAYADTMIAVSQRLPAVERMQMHYEGWAWGVCDVSNRAHEAAKALADGVATPVRP